MKGEKTPCIPSLVPVVQLDHPGKLLGRMVERSGAVTPSFISRERTGSRPALASGLIMSKVAPSRPMITVFILRACADGPCFRNHTRVVRRTSRSDQARATFAFRDVLAGARRASRPDIEKSPPLLVGAFAS